MKKIILSVATCVALWWQPAYALSAKSSSDEARHVVSSFSILNSIVAELIDYPAHDTSKSLVGNNQNSHAHQLRALDVQELQGSHLIVFNGLGFESAALQRAAKNTQVPMVFAAEGLDDLIQGEAHHHHGDDHDHNHDHDHFQNKNGLDPHVWLDPLKMPAYTRHITQALIKNNPEKAMVYGLNWQLYQLKLAHLHGENVQKLAHIPVSQRKVLTSHAAFGYMGNRYEIEFFAPVGGGHEAEASAKTLVDLIKQVKQHNIQAVFVENISDERLLQQLTKETGLSIQGTLYSDALAEDAQDYFALYRHNVNLLVQALK